MNVMPDELLWLYVYDQVLANSPMFEEKNLLTIFNALSDSFFFGLEYAPECWKGDNEAITSLAILGDIFLDNSSLAVRKLT